MPGSPRRGRTRKGPAPRTSKTGLWAGNPASVFRESAEHDDDARSDAADAMWKVKAGRTAGGPPNGDGILSLQALSGNKAVGQLLNVQRHSTANAPPAPEKEGDDDEDVVQGLWTSTPSRTPTPSVQRWPVKVGPSAAAAKGKVGAPKIGAARYSLGDIKLPGKSFVADGTSFQASIPKSKGRTLTWSLWPSAGATINAKTGKVTTPKTLGKAESRIVFITVSDPHALLPSLTTFELVDAKVAQARKDYPKFVKGGPYKFPKFVTSDNFGRFDVTYKPVAKEVHIDMKIAFRFRGLRGITRKQRAARAAYAAKFLNMAKTAWSGKFTIENVREPASVWQKLGPIKVVVNPTQVRRRRDAHFTFYERSNRAGTANVTNRGKVTFYRGDNTNSPAFNPDTQNAELKRLKNISPDLRFDKNTASLTKASKASAAFLGLYLSRMNNPNVNLAITGHAPGAKLAKERGAAAIAAIQAGGMTLPHKAKATPKVTKGADTTKAEIAPSLQPGWQNIQATTAHEFGHMLGLDDEYITSGAVVGGKIEHYKLVKAALGKKWADTSFRTVKDSSSVMHSGDDVRVQHYVTLWDALAQTTGKVGVPTPAFGQADWKLIG